VRGLGRGFDLVNPLRLVVTLGLSRLLRLNVRCLRSNRWPAAVLANLYYLTTLGIGIVPLLSRR